MTRLISSSYLRTSTFVTSFIFIFLLIIITIVKVRITLHKNNDITISDQIFRVRKTTYAFEVIALQETIGCEK